MTVIAEAIYVYRSFVLFCFLQREEEEDGEEKYIHYHTNQRKLLLISYFVCFQIFF